MCDEKPLMKEKKQDNKDIKKSILFFYNQRNTNKNNTCIYFPITLTKI